MEYGSNRKESDYLVRQDFQAYGKGIRSSESARDWHASSNSDLMGASQPVPKKVYYDHEHVRPQALQLGLSQIDREHMFDKVVTPSDVGKLNRLVIPKQHAEKYFPLDSSNEKGLILNFEDITGKQWRFRYSYWNSSQSYVMTKGWTRFVKEKKLDAGDMVSFQRGVGEAEKHRLFIDWKRRPITSTTLPFHTQFYRSYWSPFMLRPPQLTRIHPSINFQVPNPSSQYNFSNRYNVGSKYMGQVVTNNASLVYLTSPEKFGMVRGRAGSVAGERDIPVVFESVPDNIKGKKVVAAAAAKRMKLFGVNMECPISSDTSTSDDHFDTLCSSSSAISVPTEHLINQYPSHSTLFRPSSTKMYNGAPISDKGKTSMSLNLDI